MKPLATVGYEAETQGAVIDRLKELGAKSVRALDGVQESVTFPMPKGLDGAKTMTVAN